jgi:hypothetical protein
MGERTNPQGVSPRGVSIEDAGRLYAKTIRERMPQEKKRPILRESDNWYNQLPRVGVFNTDKPLPSWVPKYFPVSGIIVTSRYDKCVLIPEVIEGGIENTMRQQDHIRKRYHDIESSRIQDLSHEIINFSYLFVNKKITDKELEHLGHTTQVFLESYGIRNPRSPLFKNISTMLTKSTQKDSWGRNNPGASRFRVRSAYWSAVRQEVSNGLIEQKTNRIYELLLVEREIARVNLACANQILLGLYETFDSPGWSRESVDRADRRLNNLSRSLVINHLRGIRLAPYLKPARTVEAMLLPKGERHYDLLNTLKYYNLDELNEKPGLISENNGSKLFDSIGKDLDFSRNRYLVLGGIIKARRVIQESLDNPQNSNIVAE